jgi:hypothetical protein
VNVAVGGERDGSFPTNKFVDARSVDLARLRSRTS